MAVRGFRTTRVPDELRGAPVVPAPVHEQQPLEEAELRDRKVGGVDRLAALLARDADADVRLLDHADVVRAVADRERDGPAAALAPHERDELALLRGGHAARDDRAAEARDAQ